MTYDQIPLTDRIFKDLGFKVEDMGDGGSRFSLEEEKKHFSVMDICGYVWSGDCLERWKTYCLYTVEDLKNKYFYVMKTHLDISGLNKRFSSLLESPNK